MTDTKPMMLKFVKVLRIELDDLEADLEALVADYRRRLEEHRITDYVGLENVATLTNEEYGIRHLVRALERLDVDDFDDLDHLIATVTTQFRNEIEQAGLAPAAILIAERKVAKVRAYVTAED